MHTIVERVGEGGREKYLVSLTTLQYKQRGRTNTVCVLVRAQCYSKMWSVGGVLSFNLGTRMVVFLIWFLHGSDESLLFSLHITLWFIGSQ